MFENLKRKYIDWSAKKFLKEGGKKTRREKTFVDWERAQSVVVLMTAEQLSKERIEKMMSMMSGKSVSFWVYAPQETSLYDAVYLHIFKSKDVSLLGKPNKVVLDKFMSETADLLIDLSVGEVFPLKYMLSVSRASCKCGLSREFYDKLFDFQMNMSDKTRPEILLEQILYYLNMIRAKA